MSKVKWMSKKIAAMTMATLLGVGMFSTSAFAYADESATNEETEIMEETTEVEEETEEIIACDPLTPDGNMDLVDDYGPVTGAGKQFITVVTKSGNYFYLIIDRDDNGSENVHFLNLVDEADILSIMEEEDVTEYLANQSPTATEEPTVEQPEEETTETTEPTEEVVEVKKAPNVMLIIVLLIVVIGGCGFFVMTKVKDKKKADQNKPDPDADYEDDSMYDFMEETEMEEAEEEDEIEMAEKEEEE